MESLHTSARYDDTIGFATSFLNDSDKSAPGIFFEQQHKRFAFHADMFLT